MSEMAVFSRRKGGALSEQSLKYPGQFSGGQQQRVVIARNLCMSPKLIPLEEPTFALHSAMIKKVLNSIIELADDGMTIIVVTHEMRVAKSVAHRVLFMDFGHIVEANTADEFFGNHQQDNAKLSLSRILH